MNDIVHAQAQSMDLLGSGQPMPLMFQLYLNPVLREQIRSLAQEMAKDDLNTPEHLFDKPSACAVVITRAMVWGLDPYLVASMTFQTPNKKMGYEGALVNAAIDRHLVGGVHFRHYGDWSKVQGKFKVETSAKGHKYQVPTWTDRDAEGLGVEVSARVRGESEARQMTLELIQCHPRNSTLWATDPKTQICYTGVRRFAKVMVPAALMGLPPDLEDMPREINMGEADRVIDAGIQQPRRTGAAAADVVDTETGEVLRGGEQSDAPPPPPSENAQASGGPARITEAALRILQAKLQDPELTVRFLTHFKIANLDELPMAQVNAGFQWCAQQGGEPAPAAKDTADAPKGGGEGARV